MQAHVERALELRRAARWDEAVIELEAALVDDPRNAYALTQLAFCQLRRQRPREALAELEKAEAAGGATAISARLRGDALYRLGRHRDAGRAYEEADALGDRGSWCMVQLARCRLREQDLDGARGAAARAVERDPRSPAAWGVLGDVAARAGDTAQAEAHYAKAHELRPDDEFTYARLIELRLLQLPPEDRARELEVLLRSSGRDNRHLNAVLARLRSQLGDERGAAAAWRRSQGADRDLYARKMEGYALRRAGQLDEAASVLGECLLRQPDDVILFRTYVRMQRERGALDELERILQELLPVAGERRGAVYGELKRLRAG